MRITAAVLEQIDTQTVPHRITLEQIELDDPRDDEVLVRVISCGVCGTDRGCLHGVEPYPTPGVLGHEAAGVVEAVGRNVTRVHNGDRVMIGFPFCGRCYRCLRGEQRYCEKNRDLTFSGYRLDGSGGMRRRNGEELAGRFFQQSSWATHTVALEQQLARVPDSIELEMAGPYGCSISTGAGTVLNELRPEPGTSLAVFGAGNVGLAAVMAARLTSVEHIIVIDKVPERLALARELGATHTFHASSDTVEEIKELTRHRLDYAIEATNGANLVADAVAALGMRGTCAVVGGSSPSAKVTLKHADLLGHGKRLIGVMGGGGQTPAFLESLMALQGQGRFPLEKLVRFYDFADVNRAIDDSDAGITIKPILRMPA
ncbi:NAD(P)-dependent alcohol dehydrogenase [Dyella jejuensis]|uniref:NAD(P)-dependent alcohol dehydrogenase n=1 Tax=Dyella jejuensis TaxID=1432009 RepID=A0ABW8JLA9_9GAMM